MTSASYQLSFGFSLLLLVVCGLVLIGLLMLLCRVIRCLWDCMLWLWYSMRGQTTYLYIEEVEVKQKATQTQRERACVKEE